MKKLASLLLCGVLAFSATACFNFGGEKDSYTVSYSFGGSIHELQVKPDSLYQLETVPYKEGYTFLGLFDEDEGGTKYVDEAGISLKKYTLKEDLVLYPQFVPKKYTFALEYGATVSPFAAKEITVTYDGEVKGLPVDIKIDRKDFSGWFTEPNGEGVQIADATGILPSKKIFNADAYPVPETQNGTFYAYYTDTLYTVTYCFDQTVQSKVQGIFGDSVNALSPDIRVGYQYVAAWSTQENDEDMSHTVASVLGDMTVYPCLLGNAIFFENTGDVLLPKIVAPEGNQITLPVPTREGYDFVCWMYNGNEPFTQTTMPDRTVTLKAQWELKPNTITLDENGGNDLEDICQKAGTELYLPSCSRSGYEFAGWYTEAGEKFAETAMPEQDITLIARWYKRHTVTKVLTSGERHVAHEHTGILFTIDLSEYLNADSTTDIYVSAAYDLKVKNWTNFLVTPPHWFDFKFYERNQVNDAYKLGDRVCEWDKNNQYASSNGSFYATLHGNAVYISAQSNTWVPGYLISNFRVTISFTENELEPLES